MKNYWNHSVETRSSNGNLGIFSNVELTSLSLSLVELRHRERGCLCSWSSLRGLGEPTLSIWNDVSLE